MHHRPPPSPARRRRLERRALPIAALAAVSFALGVTAGALHVPGDQRVAERFAAAWRRGDYAGMWDLLADGPRARLGVAQLARAYRQAASIATARALRIGKPRHVGDRLYAVPVTATTYAFGVVRGTVRLPLSGSGGSARVAWAPNLTFPDVPPGGALSRTTTLPARATLLARDGTPLAEGADRSSPLGPVAAAVVGDLGAIPADQAARLRARGYPAGAKVGVSGLERIFEDRLAGTPGGQLLAGGRVLASAPPRAAPPVRTTIDPAVQSAVVAALAGRLGGVLAMRARSGEVLGVAGIAFSGLQPPGSTFKMVTLSAVLEAHLARPSSVFPYATFATLSGVKLANANGESCGGTLAQAFAVSCNSVFAPLGAQLGARRLVDAARRFGFDTPPPIPGAATSTIPPADQLGDDLAVGSSAIGQGRVQATVLQMATVAGAIARDGRRPVPTLTPVGGRAPVGPRATSARVAHEVRRMMIGVVAGGTGASAAIPGVTVAGKTGTAELRTTVPCVPDPTNPESCPPDQQANDPTDTDAWFAAFAPAAHPRVVVGVMLVGAGAGGDTAAPAARGVLLAALKRAG